MAKAQSDTYNEYTNQAPLIGWALANVYLMNHDELNALHTLDRLIELTAPQSLVQTKAVELRHKIKNRKRYLACCNKRVNQNHMKILSIILALFAISLQYMPKRIQRLN